MYTMYSLARSHRRTKKKKKRELFVSNEVNAEAGTINILPNVTVTRAPQRFPVVLLAGFQPLLTLLPDDPFVKLRDSILPHKSTTPATTHRDHRGGYNTLTNYAAYRWPTAQTTRTTMHEVGFMTKWRSCKQRHITVRTNKFKKKCSAREWDRGLVSDAAVYCGGDLFTSLHSVLGSLLLHEKYSFYISNGFCHSRRQTSSTSLG